MKTVLMNGRLKEGHLDVTRSPSLDAEKLEVFGCWPTPVEPGDHLVFEELGQSHTFVVDSFDGVHTAHATFVRREPLESSRLVETIRDQFAGIVKLGGVIQDLLREHPELKPTIHEKMGWEKP